MSYVRFGEDGSDVYLFVAADHGGLECCACRLRKEHSRFPRFFASAEARSHFAEHRAAGDVVPRAVEEEVLADFDRGEWPVSDAIKTQRP